MKELDIKADDLSSYVAAKASRYKLVTPIVQPYPYLQNISTTLFHLASYLYWLFATSEVAPEPFQEAKEDYQHELTTPLQQWMIAARRQGYERSSFRTVQPGDFAEITQAIDSGLPLIAQLNTAVGPNFHLIIGYYYADQQLYFISLAPRHYVEFSAAEVMAPVEILIIEQPVTSATNKYSAERFFPMAQERRQFAEEKVSQVPEPPPSRVAESPLIDEFAALRHDAEERQIKIPPDLTIDAMVEYRRKHNLPKYLPYKLLINFIEVDTALGGKFSAVQLREMYTTFLINDVIIAQRRHYPSKIDDSIDDDIRKQTDPYNSLAEVVCNAKDAGSTQVIINIVEGEYYEVIDDGFGMSAQTIHQKALLPKATSKSDAKESIGRFGIGLQTIHSHLCDETSYTSIDTKAENEPGITLRFKLDPHDGRTILVTSGLSERETHGTTIRVYSKQIRRDLFIAALLRRVNYFTAIPIIVNQQIINQFALRKLVVTPVSQSSVIFDKNATEREAVITINGMTFEQVQCKPDSMTGLVIWAVPETTEYSEKRKGIHVNQDAIRLEIKALIDYAERLPEQDQIIYYNTIAPLIKCLQEANSSTLERDNLLRYLQNKVLHSLGRRLQVPDEIEFRLLHTPERIRLNGNLLRLDWREAIGYRCQEWQAEKVVVWITDLMEDPNACFIYDDEKEHVYLDAHFYRTIISDYELNVVKLRVLFERYHPVILGKWLDGILPAPSEEKKPSVVAASSAAVASGPIVPFTLTTAASAAVSPEATRTAEPESKLALQERYPQMKFSKFSAENLKIVEAARTLFQLHIGKEILEYGHVRNKLSEYYYKGRTYFCYETRVDNKLKIVLVDNQFRVLTTVASKILAEHCKRLYLKGIVNVEIEIDATDLFLLACKESWDPKILVNAEGKAVIKQEFYRHSDLVKINHDYYLVLEDGTSLLIHNKKSVTRFNRLAFHAENENLIDFIIDSSRRDIYSLSQQKFIVEGAAVLFPSQGTIFCIVNDYTRLDEEIRKTLSQQEEKAHATTVNTGFILDDLGRIIISLPDAISQKLLATKRFELQIVNETYYFSFSDENVSHLVKYNKNDESWEYFSPEQTFGFPVHTYLVKSATVQHLCFCAPHDVYPSHQALVCKVVKAFVNEQDMRRVDSYGISFLNHKEKLANSYYVYALDKQLFVMTPQRQWICLPPQFSNLSNIVKLEFTHNFLLVSYKKYGLFLTQYAVNTAGFCIAEGEDIKTTENVCGSYLLINGKRVINEEGRVLYESDKKIAEINAAKKLNYIIIKWQSGNNSPLATNMVINVETGAVTNGCVYVRDDAVLSVGGVVITPYGIITNADIWGGRDTYTTSYAHLHLSGAPILEPELPFQKFNTVINDGKYLCASMFSITDKLHLPIKDSEIVLYRLLSSSQLHNPECMRVMAWLNQQQLPSHIYSRCLVFIDCPIAAIAALIPYFDVINYIPTREQSMHYCNVIETLTKAGVSGDSIRQIVRLIDLSYLLYGHVTATDMANKIMLLYQQYGIQKVVSFYALLQENYKKLQSIDFDMTEKREIINNFPEEMAIFCYFLFFESSMLLLKTEYALAFPAVAQQHEAITLSMVVLNTVITLRPEITHIAKNMLELQQLCREVSAEKQHQHSLRKIRHAIYHLSDVNRMLYLREFLQNGLDAVRARRSGKSDLHFKIFMAGKNEVVLRFEDAGVGMTQEDILLFLCCPGASTKRYQSGFIGGRGVGFFTAFHTASKVVVKTSKGDGITYYCELIPQRDEQGNINDITINLLSCREAFCGTRIEHYAGHPIPELLASAYHRVIKTHGMFVDAREANIYVNDVSVNRALKPLAKMAVKGLGEIELYESVDHVVTVGGLYLQKFEHERVVTIPTEIRNALAKNGLVLNLCGKVDLNRDRSDFENPSLVWEKLKVPLVMLAIKAYLFLVQTRCLSLNELPYDFFAEFLQREAQVKARNPHLKRDISRLMYGLAIDLVRYTSTQAITDLMVYCQVVPHRQNESESERYYSLIELADLYMRKQLTNTKDLPAIIQQQIMFAEKSKSMQTLGLSTLRVYFGDTAKHYEDKIWQPIDFSRQEEWRFFYVFSQDILRQISAAKVVPRLYFTTVSLDALAFAHEDSIYWNVVSVYPMLTELWQSLVDNNVKKFTDLVISIVIYTLAHEKVHTQEERCSGTHNKAFDLRVHRLLTPLFKTLNVRMLFNSFREQYSEHFGQARKTLKEFLVRQLPHDEERIYPSYVKMRKD